jgi:glycerol-3-phosphate dehydrogenase (NAD(P)+)
MKNLDPSKIAIIGPGRLGTAFAYKFGRDGKNVTIYYHDAEICREINQTHLNPRHLTDDLAKISGGMENIPRLSGVTATNDLEKVVEENDFIILSITMNRLQELLDYIKPLIAKKKGRTCLVSPIKGLASNEKTSELVTPSQMVKNHLFDLKHKFDIICIGGPFFDVDIATGRPVCVTVAGDKRAAKTFSLNFLRLNRKELNSYYNFDLIGIEACGALKNIIANIKGAADCLNLGNSLPGTIFARSGVEIRALVKLLGGSFQAFQSQAGVGDMYVTVSSEASKNYKYGKYFYELFDGNPIATSIKTLKKIDGTPEGPNTIKSVHRYLEKKNMYSPLFRCAYKIFHEETNRDEIVEHIIQACQFDKRNREYIGPFSKLLYRIFPEIWYRRHKGFLSKLDLRKPSR